MAGITPLQTSSILGLLSFSGTTSSSPAGNVVIDLGSFDTSRNLAISGIVWPADNGNQIPPEFTSVGGYQYSVWVNDFGLNIQNHLTNSENILSRPFRISIMYGK